MKYIAGLIVVVALATSILGIAGSVGLDIRDGGDAQVIRVEPPPLSLTPQYDQAYADIYKTYAEGNKMNAEADAITTSSNADSTMTIVGIFLASLAVVAAAIVLIKIAEGL